MSANLAPPGASPMRHNGDRSPGDPERSSTMTQGGAQPASLAELPRPLALVLSGGASLGAVQVGQLRAIVELGVVPDLIVGTSVGAINGLFMAREFSPAHVDRLESVWVGLGERGVFADVGVASTLRLLWRGGSLASPALLERLILRELPRVRSELAVPAHVVAADYLSGRTVILSGGDLQRNALASAAIPNVFPPVEIDGRLLVDGGISANVPVLPAAELGAATMVVLDAGFPCALTSPPRGIVSSVLHAMTLTLRNQVAGVLPALARERSIVYLPAPCPLAVSPHDFSSTSMLIRAGYDLAAAALGSLDVRGPGVHGHPHFHGGLHPG